MLMVFNGLSVSSILDAGWYDCADGLYGWTAVLNLALKPRPLEIVCNADYNAIYSVREIAYSNFFLYGLVCYCQDAWMHSRLRGQHASNWQSKTPWSPSPAVVLWLDWWSATKPGECVCTLVVWELLPVREDASASMQYLSCFFNGAWIGPTLLDETVVWSVQLFAAWSVCDESLHLVNTFTISWKMFTY